MKMNSEEWKLTFKRSKLNYIEAWTFKKAQFCCIEMALKRNEKRISHLEELIKLKRDSVIFVWISTNKIKV